MDNDRIIVIVLVAIIAALLVGVFATMTHMEKQDTNLTFESNATLTEGDSLKIKLTDANGTAIANQTVNITVTDENNTEDKHSIVTDDDGTGKLQLDKIAGEYNVTVNYGGNDNYTGCNATQKLKIKEEVKETASSSESSNSGGWTTVSPGGDAGSSIVVYHDGNGHKYVTRYSSDGSAYEDGIAYDEDYPITS